MKENRVIWQLMIRQYEAIIVEQHSYVTVLCVCI